MAQVWGSPIFLPMPDFFTLGKWHLGLPHFVGQKLDLLVLRKFKAGRSEGKGRRSLGQLIQA